MQIRELLEKLGLNKQETEVYLAGLKSGPILAIKLAQKTGIKRVSVYDVLRSLENKGLVSKGSKSYSKYFIMESPTKLQERLKQRAGRVKMLQRELERNLPAIKAFAPSPEITPEVKIFEGKEGIATMINGALKLSVSEIRIIRGGRDIEKILGKDFINDFVRKKVQKGIRSRSIRGKGISRTTPEQDKRELRETRYLPSSIKCETTVVIYGDNLAVVSSREEDFGFSIRSKELAHFFEIFFEMLWEASSKSY